MAVRLLILTRLFKQITMHLWCGSPYCGFGSFKKNGLYNTNLQRYQCKQCGRSFNILTGTLFENHKISITEWIDYILQTISYESNSSISLNGRNSESTTPYWMHKLFLALEGYQEDIVLCGNVQIDETFYTVMTSSKICLNIFV